MGSRVRDVGKFMAWGFGVVCVGGLSGLLGILAVVYALVFFGDDSALKKSTILARINEETNIYMLDGETQIGSIFSDGHRAYVPIDDVPAHMINAIIAAEDKNFYDHAGIDPTAIFSAGIDFLTTGRKRGASTLTQQTVRNILGWWELSLARKFKEWIAALQIERLYSKRQILEFYLNQFHVSGNGRGIGIAARYYFNKDVRDLDLVESAFIAGSVKGPSTYDPFIKFTRERRERAITNAFHRKNYVLKRMYEQGWITEEQFKEAWEEPVKFNRGKFRSDEVALVHVIKQQLARKEILEALGITDPRELAAAGLKIHTTIDAEMQQAAQLAVRRNLSRLDTILRGFAPEKPELFRKLRNLTVNDFYYGKVEAITGMAKAPALKLSFGDLISCDVPYESLMRYAKWLDLPWYQGWEKQLKTMLSKLKVGDIVYVEVREYDPETHHGICELNKRPQVNGGLIALDKGEVRAVVSGFDTKGFNRSIQARKQPGSVFKPVAYFAALQLGWSILDRLDNDRQIFPFQGRFYYPRPDHDTPYKEVSMLWAGILSENLASVALASRLVEKLNFEQFKQLLGVMELLPNPGEAPRDFHYRVARAMGVTLDNDGVKEFQLTNAIGDLLLDIQYSTSYEFQQTLKKMWWGRGYAAEMQAIALATDDQGVGQKAIKIKLAKNNFHRMQALQTQLGVDWAVIEAAVSGSGADAAFMDANLQKILERFRVLPGMNRPALGYVATLEGEWPDKDFRGRTELERLNSPPGRPLNALDVQAIWGGSIFGSAGLGLGDVLLDGWLPSVHFTTLADYVERRYNDIMSRSDDYDLARYWQHHDFRIAVGLNYLVKLARAMGVTSDIEPVLSFPLGTNVVTLAEVAKIYQTFVSGKTYRFYQEGPPNQINFIRRIEDRYGNTLYEPRGEEFQLVMPEFGLQMREMLQRVFTHGTGRSGRAELYLTLGDDTDPKNAKRIRVPAFGKTGTTNDYNVANFAGFMPYPLEKGQPLDPENSYVIATYTGYDMNKMMRNGAIRVSGAVGALPAWVGLAKAIIDKKKYADYVDPLDLGLIARQEWPLKHDERSTPLAIDMARGVVMGGGGVEQETVTMTDVAREGESRFDEYRANIVETTLRLPVQSGAPLRMFSPFKVEELSKGLKPTRVELKPSPISASSSKRDARNPEVRAYDQRGNRVGDSRTEEDEQASPASVPVAGAPVMADPGARGSAVQDGAQDARASGAPSTDDLFHDLADPGQGIPPPSPAADDDAGFVEEDLW